MRKFNEAPSNGWDPEKSERADNDDELPGRRQRRERNYGERNHALKPVTGEGSKLHRPPIGKLADSVENPVAASKQDKPTQQECGLEQFELDHDATACAMRAGTRLPKVTKS